METRITTAELFDKIEQLLNNLPLGYGYQFSFGTDGTQPPTVKVEIEGEYDNLLERHKVHTAYARTDYHEQNDFENLLEWTEQIVSHILEKQEPVKIEQLISDDDENLPF